MLRSSLRVACSIAVLALAACSSSGAAVPTDGGTSGSGLTPENTTWCTGEAAGCNAVNVCGVCVQKPTKDLVRTNDTKEYTGTGAPDVSCFDAAGLPKPAGTSKNVTMHGHVKPFASGADSKDVKIEIYEEELDGAGMQTGKLGRLVATTFSDPAAGEIREEIVKKSGIESTIRYYPYKVEGIPTEKPLIIKTSGKDASAGWFELYDFNQVAWNDKLDGTGAWQVDIRALADNDYASILKTAYNRPPEGGKSAIAGEVHDCGDVRLSNATAELGPKSTLPLFYMSEAEDDPLPDGDRRATGKLGLYAVGGLAPNVYRLSAVGNIDGKPVALGSYQVQTFANAVTVYTFRGLRPWQVKK